MKLFDVIANAFSQDEDFHDESEREKLQFFRPEHISNRQEYILKKVSPGLESQGKVTYYRDGVETKLFHFMYWVPKLDIVVQQLANSSLAEVSHEPDSDREEGMNLVIGPRLNPLDEVGPVTSDQKAEIHKAAPTYEELSPSQELLETGIKVIDLICPFAKGGKG